jgi:hypothetical protein
MPAISCRADGLYLLMASLLLPAGGGLEWWFTFPARWRAAGFQAEPGPFLTPPRISVTVVRWGYRR